MRISDWSSDVCSADLVRDHVEGDLHRIDLRLDRLEVEQAGGLAAEFLQRPAPGTRHRLVGGHVDALDPGRAMQRRQRDHQLHGRARSEEHTSELQSLMRISYAVFCLKKKTNQIRHNDTITS